MKRLARHLAACTLAVLPAASSAQAADVVLRVGLADELFVDSEIRVFDARLQLKNQGDTPVYVSPVIGQLEGELRILARCAGSNERPVILYDKAFKGAGRDIEDLFRLMPHRTLQLSLDMRYPEPDIAGKEGMVEIWAEYDCRGMRRFGPDALAVRLVSEPVVAPIVMLGANRKGDSEPRSRRQER